MNIKLFAVVSVGGLLIASVAGAQLMRRNYDEPKHTVVVDEGSLQIRNYETRIVAETRVSSSDWRSGVSEGFSRLAGFIFGKNQDSAGESAKIAMTTPVESMPADEGHIVTFTMPPKYTVENLPSPQDARVTVRVVPPTTIATITFSGVARSNVLTSYEESLKNFVTAQGYRMVSEIKVAQYDPPWVAGPFRRNELMVDVSKP